MCYEQVKDGGMPACAEACLFGATVFGERDELVREAQKRIAENPDSYVDHIYGLKEAGGTSVLFLSGVPFADLGFPTGLPDEPIPKLSWRILKEIPRYAVVSGLLLYGIHWITARRAEVAQAESTRQKENS
jgi:formate dehydrogenase iron-sulfur subunit